MYRTVVPTLFHRFYSRLRRRRGQPAAPTDLLHQGRQRALRWWAEQEGDQARCDVCGQVLAQGEGYLIGAAFVYQSGVSANGEGRDSPWLVCSKCMTERANWEGPIDEQR